MKTKSDVIVIGAGVIGLCSAYYLAKAGHSVIVLEKTDGSDSCSYGNAGLISPSHFVPLSSPGIMAKGLRWMLNPESPFFVKPRLSLPLVKWGWQFMQHATHKHVSATKKLLADLSIMSLDLHEEFAGENNIIIDKKGVLMHCLTKKCLAHEIEMAGMANDLGIPTKIMGMDEVDALDPTVKHNGVGAVHFPGDAYMEPEAFMQQMKKSLNELDVEIYNNQEVTGFESRSGKISKVISTKAEFAADEVVLATGSYTAPLLKLIGERLLLEAGKGYSVDWLDSPVMPELAYILLEARVAITPLNGAVRLAGTMELGGINLSVNHRRVAGFLKSIEDYLPDFKYEKVKSLPVWAGLRPCSPDGLPYVGKDTKYHNLTIATGHAMLGFTLGPVTGKLVTEIIGGAQTSLNIDQLAVDRY